MKAWSSEKISVLALVLLITGAIDSIRNLPATALFGSSLIFFFVFSAIVFLIPVALVAAELSSTWPDEEGGIYSWVRHAFGESAAFFAVWLQWINTMVWYPTILSFIAGTLAYLIDPNLAQNKFYIIAVILIVFWSLTFLGLRGLHASARFAGFCAITGMLIPMMIIIILGVVWVFGQHPMAISLAWPSLIPDWKSTESWVSLTAIMTSFLGMELAAVHVRNVKHPQHNFPKAMFLSVILILVTMIFGSLAIAVVLPQKEIRLVQGVMQAIHNFFAAYHLHAWMPVFVIMLLLGSIGGMINWIISPAKGLLMAAHHGFFPERFYRLNRHGIASNILILQAILVTLLCSLFLFFPSVNAIYWLFTALSTELYMMMYLLMFVTAFHLKRKFKDLPRPFAIPGGRVGYYSACFLGVTGAFVTLIVGFFPPVEALDFGSVLHFRIIFLVGILGMLLPALLLLRLKRQVSIAPQPE